MSEHLIKNFVVIFSSKKNFVAVVFYIEAFCSSVLKKEKLLKLCF